MKIKTSRLEGFKQKMYLVFYLYGELIKINDTFWQTILIEFILAFVIWWKIVQDE